MKELETFEEVVRWVNATQLSPEGKVKAIFRGRAVEVWVYSPHIQPFWPIQVEIWAI